MEQCNEASEHRKHHEDRDEAEGSKERQRIDNLLKAVHAAEEEVKDLEYWSDIQQIARSGHASGVANGSSEWPSEQWQGLDPSGPGSNFHSQAKEDGKTSEELHRDVEVIGQKVPEQDIKSKSEESAAESPRENDDLDLDDPKPLSSDEFFSPPEDSPIKIDKGKGRAD